MFYNKRLAKMVDVFERTKHELHFTLLVIEEAANPALIYKAFAEKLDELYRTYLFLAKQRQEEPFLSLRYNKVKGEYRSG